MKACDMPLTHILSVQLILEHAQLFIEIACTFIVLVHTLKWTFFADLSLSGVGGGGGLQNPYVEPHPPATCSLAHYKLSVLC